MKHFLWLLSTTIRDVIRLDFAGAYEGFLLLRLHLTKRHSKI